MLVGVRGFFANGSRVTLLESTYEFRQTFDIFFVRALKVSRDQRSA